MEAKHFVSRKGRYVMPFNFPEGAVILRPHYQRRVTNNWSVCSDPRRPDFREGGVGGTNSTAVHPGDAEFFLEQPLSVSSGRASDLQWHCGGFDS